MQYNGLPVYIAKIDEETGLQVVSFVTDPAIERDFLAFDSQKEMMRLEVQDEEKRICFGPALIPGQLVYRRTANNFEYYVTFPEDTIRETVEKFFKENRNNDTDTQHNWEVEPGVTMVETYFKDEAKGVSPKGFEDLPDGTWFVSYHVENDEVWDRVKSGELKGFSIAGYFIMEETENDLAIAASKTDNNKDNTNKMSKLARIKSLLQKALYEFGQISTDKGVLSFNDSDELEVGMEVFLLDEDGQESKPEDGNYETEARIYVIEDGKVAEIQEKEKEDNEPENEPEEEVEAHEEAPAEGKEAPETVEVSTFRAVGLAFEATYDEKLTAIAQAVREAGMDAYVVEAADTYCVVCAWNEEGGYYDKYYRFDIAWDEEGKPSLSNMQEVREEFVPADEPSPFEEVENLRAEIETLRAQLNEPKGTPAVEEFRQATEAPKTGSAKLDRALRILTAK